MQKNADIRIKSLTCGGCNKEIQDYEDDKSQSCDECGKPLSLLEYYNQDGLCVACFKRWCEDDL